MNAEPHVAIVGATGAVGEEMLLCLEQRNFPVGKLTLLASARSAGKRIPFRGEDVIVQELTHDSFAGVDIADSRAKDRSAHRLSTACSLSGIDTHSNS